MLVAEIEKLYPVIAICPFCGGKSSPNTNWRDIWVECDECGARGPKFNRHNWRKAIIGWSMRR